MYVRSIAALALICIVVICAALPGAQTGVKPQTPT